MEETDQDEIAVAWIHTMKLCIVLQTHLQSDIVHAPPSIIEAMETVGDWVCFEGVNYAVTMDE